LPCELREGAERDEIDPGGEGRQQVRQRLGVAGGVVVYLANDSALGFLLFMATLRGLQIFNCVVVTTSCVPLVAQLLLYELLSWGFALTSWRSITCAFFFTAIPANKLAKFDEMP
jgi:hypothetical protein